MTDSCLFFTQGIGCTKITKARNEGPDHGNSESRSYLEKKLVFCFGSYVASQMLLPLGEENFLSSSEIQQAQEVGVLSMKYEFYRLSNFFCSLGNAMSVLSRLLI